MRLGDDGKLYPLFIDSATPTEIGRWYDADSPSIKNLEGLEPGYAYKIDRNGDVVERKPVHRTEKGSITGLPNVASINKATNEQCRWVAVTTDKKGALAYHNVGINGAGQPGTYAMRPGWHAGSLPSMRQIGKGSGRNLRDDKFVWVEGEIPADVDYQPEADRNPQRDIPTHIPENGYYMKATNANKAASQADRIWWYIAGAFKANRVMSDAEARNVIDGWNAQHPDEPVEYDFEREGGKPFTDEDAARVNTKASRALQTDTDMKRQTVEQMGERLHTDITVIEDVNEITHSNPLVQERRRRAKGWYDRRTGKVYVVLANNKDIDDVRATVAHETIAHKGLRELVGEERYGEFLDETYRHLRDDLKEGVDRAAGRAFMDDATRNGERARSYEEHRREAVDELFGRLAEKPFEEFTEGERTLWQRLKAAARKLLDRFLGSLKLPKWFELGDNELRYILWRSKERMERLGHGKPEHTVLDTADPIEMAKDIVKREELGLDDDVRYNMGDAPETFKARQRRAVENKGTVMPGLNEAEVKVVDVPRHPYTGSIKEATQQAIDAAKAKYVPNGEPRILHYNNFGAEFDYSISGNAIETVLSAKHQGKSVNKGVHLALAEHLDRVIGESIEVEEHPDRIKAGDVRDNSKINPDALMHRFYGVANIDGVDYRVMTLMKEENKAKRGNGIHSYEVQKIEVLDEQTPNTSNGVGTLNSELEGYPLAKVIQNVGKTMEKDKKLLDESKIADEGTDLYRDPDDTTDIWKDKSLGLQERITAAKTRLADGHRDNLAMRDDALRAISNNLADLAKSMLGRPRKTDLTDSEREKVARKVGEAARVRKGFDMATVKRVSDLARVLMRGGYLSGMNKTETQRLLAAVRDSVGHDDIGGDVQKVMVKSQLRQGKTLLGKYLRIRGSKVILTKLSISETSTIKRNRIQSHAPT